MTAPATPPTTDELRQAFDRAAALRFLGWTFEKALAVGYMRWSLEKSAIAARRTHHLPAQPRLI
jgi:hypothetical protein